ncbi:hypothetical protein A3D05_05720 [Candidatus Gottesmanbacteria bacterium RIFCSPHIGHO2_02_FULL_40_24]|uniref:Methyltransferase domain-containing protein n=1 Tax=Candidatus Gottesmanbacteria bacterium RIFCSPHIGHO2_01_FULL_40_15 TaxID=1798376 RepID=A0A1F5Z7C2_9BACT|nr:MAG: hypothetical protein A2777_02355 [Candidatus Gottesmanbacteria bacterium RIFCSPHIGHO2_01_FULL_40_15]OGG16526.1 MAG: hypothetical protein A3D05_05720 [Candidatus Gottesmanbacteria bacterium RIFCSPHIGHO2_02_FULL_40_24]OGG25639.1 MAG: hypothetical protein A3E42_04870 [Candidatus Gottesmanbacteria bacterium RIFCSPHIGHO2_12_FULL_40_13]OGG32642.1 MAG: hypothetical protein A3I80_06365 [Candidatus Gottesmanbacteria bacterium RIFCSPLOWO2_02_FULL_40_10]
MNLQSQNDIKNHFDRLYQADVTPWKNHPPEPAFYRFMNILKTDIPGAKILDIGCGDGWISQKAAKLSFEVWGIDSSETAINQAKGNTRANAINGKMHFRTGDALSLPYQTAFFDALLDRGLFHHILPENRRLYFKNILRVLKKKSYLYLAVFSYRNPENIGQRFEKNDVVNEFYPFFKIKNYSEDPFEHFAPAHLLHFIMERKSI